jgi:hypothetical protein
MRHEDFIDDEPFVRARLADVERFLATTPPDHVIDRISWEHQKTFWLECLEKIGKKKENE